MSPVDFALIQKCLAGNKAAWDEFVLLFSDLIYDAILRTFRRYGHAGQDAAADLHNDIFVHILEEDGRVLRIFEGRNGCRLAHYLRTITVRHTVDYLRKVRPSVPYDDEVELAADAALDGRNGGISNDMLSVLSSKEEAELAWQLMGELSEQEIELCRLIFLESRPASYIAGRLGISPDNLYVRKNRLLDRLRALAAARGLAGNACEVRTNGK